jgi:hypothetical protein
MDRLAHVYMGLQPGVLDRDGVTEKRNEFERIEVHRSRFDLFHVKNSSLIERRQLHM